MAVARLAAEAGLLTLLGHLAAGSLVASLYF